MSCSWQCFISTRSSNLHRQPCRARGIRPGFCLVRLCDHGLGSCGTCTRCPRRVCLGSNGRGRRGASFEFRSFYLLSPVTLVFLYMYLPLVLSVSVHRALYGIGYSRLDPGAKEVGIVTMSYCIYTRYTRTRDAFWALGRSRIAQRRQYCTRRPTTHTAD